MSAALKLDQQNSTVQNIAPPAPEKVKSGIKYYDEIVFSKIEKKQKVFNWYAGLFSPYWFAYKGMWKSYAMWVVPNIMCSSIIKSTGMNLTILLGTGIGFIIASGQTANKDYHTYCKLNKNSKSNVWAGIGGIFVVILITSFLDGFIPSFTKNFSASYTKSRNALKNKEQRQPQSAQTTVEANEESYTQSSMAIMDGEKAIGKGLSFTGMYLGIQTVDETPVVVVSDLNGGAQWLISFGEQYKPTIAQLKVGGSYQFICRIMKIDTLNICQME